jgi:hypothetical protein
MQIKEDFAYKPAPPIKAPAPPNPLGALSELPGIWEGTGFNLIWRPLRDPSAPKQDHFLELNLTDENIEFTGIKGNIPNRGLLQDDINLFGIHYLQQIKDSNTKGGLHVEPGLWVNIPNTTDPLEKPTVCRMASIPHGTTINAQGTGVENIKSGPIFATASTVPFVIGNPSDLVPFPESTLSVPTSFRSPPADIMGITQAMVDDPNSVLAARLVGHTVLDMTVLQINSLVSGTTVPNAGGGTDNIAFLTGAAPSNTPNANSAQVSATFWIEHVRDDTTKNEFHLLQYTQTVLLNFRGLSWPHVSVANLRKK